MPNDEHTDSQDSDNHSEVSHALNTPALREAISQAREWWMSIQEAREAQRLEAVEHLFEVIGADVIEEIQALVELHVEDSPVPFSTLGDEQNELYAMAKTPSGYYRISPLPNGAWKVVREHADSGDSEDSDTVFVVQGRELQHLLIALLTKGFQPNDPE